MFSQVKPFFKLRVVFIKIIFVIRFFHYYNCSIYKKTTKLGKLIELNKLKKENRKNRLEDKIKQQEYYGDMEELFDPLTKTLKANTKRNLALGEETLRAIDSQNQELDKETKMMIE